MRKAVRRQATNPWHYPEALRPGDLVAIVAPASPFPAAEFWRAAAWLRDRYRLRLESGAFSRAGYLAGDDERRGGELVRALLDPEVRAIVCARGGYGSMRIVDKLPLDAFCRAPKWLVGFSDITALHAELSMRGVASIHGPNVTGMGRRARPDERAALLRALERPHVPQTWSGLDVLVHGEAEGTTTGGNLALVHAMLAGGWRPPAGSILFLEDVTERPYRIDRMLASIARLGLPLAGVVFGSFTQCEPGADGVSVDEVLRHWATQLGVPTLAGAPFGHGETNYAFVLGARAQIRDGTVTMARDVLSG